MVESLIGSSVKVYEHVNNRLRIYRRPEKESSKGAGEEILSQADIDKIVEDMLRE